MEKVKTMELIEKVKNGDEAAMGEIGAMYKNTVQNVAHRLITHQEKYTPELANALLAAMVSLERLVIDFQGEEAEEFDVYVANNLEPNAEKLLIKIGEYKRNYTVEGLITLAETDDLARLILTASEVQAQYPAGTKIDKIKGLLGKFKNVVCDVLSVTGPIMPTSDFQKGTAVCGDMVVHIRPIFDTSSESKTTL
ncbi:MAG: hypothetical protein PHI24_08785 [Desulfitobacteriaceae bacterium]|nr:hypothetical protein [Desulfitobacteriaceae bacterium]